jgi:SRSO17 transposase
MPLPSYATPGGHALVGARIYVPADQMDDPERRAALGIDAQIEFKTKPQLAVDILTDMVADHTMRTETTVTRAGIWTNRPMIFGTSK